MSWAAHELESYVIQRHSPVAISYLGVLAGTLLPDLATKLWVYGFSVGGHHIGVANPARSIGAGRASGSPTRSPSACWWPLWSCGARAAPRGLWASSSASGRTLSPTSTTASGPCSFFPFSTAHFSTGMWAYAATEGRHGDAAAYYSSLGGVWDVAWLLVALGSWRVLSAGHFYTKVATADGGWTWLKARFSLPDVVVVAAYRAYFLYGASRIVAWTIWAHAVEGSPWDLRWGGPWFVERAETASTSGTGLAIAAAVGTVGLAVTGAGLWRACARARTSGSEAPVLPSKKVED